MKVKGGQIAVRLAPPPLAWMDPMERNPCISCLPGVQEFSTLNSLPLDGGGPAGVYLLMLLRDSWDGTLAGGVMNNGCGLKDSESERFRNVQRNTRVRMPFVSDGQVLTKDELQVPSAL
jgi:hypothetical protein